MQANNVFDEWHDELIGHASSMRTTAHKQSESVPVQTTTASTP